MNKLFRVLWPMGKADSRRARLLTVSLLPRVSGTLTVAIAGITLASSLTPVGFAVLGGSLVGAIPEAVSMGPESAEARLVLIQVLGVGLLFALQQVLGPLQTAFSNQLGDRIDQHLQLVGIEAASEPAGIGHLEASDFQDKAKVAQGIGTSGSTPGKSVPAIAGMASLYITAIFSMLVFAKFSLTLAAIISAMMVLSRQRWKFEYFSLVQSLLGRTDELRKADYLKELATSPPAAKETRVFGLKDWIQEGYSSVWLGVMKDVWKKRRTSTRIAILTLVINWVPLFVALRALALSAVAETISLGDMSIYAMALLTGRRAWKTVGQYDLPFEYGVASAPVAIQLREAASKGILESGSRSALRLPREVIRFDGVTFRYPNLDRDVFKDLSLEIPAGKSTAIVGVNGAGKTTLVKLLCRLYDPDAGKVTIDGIDLRELDVFEWHKNVAAIFQDFVQYHLSLRDNISFRSPETLDETLLADAAHKAGIADLPAALPLGWETVLSRQYKDGADLSGGQWQRVGLARAFAAAGAGASILILDEPTANLDVRGEAELYDRFLDLTRGLTTVLISHRFSTVRKADRVCLIEGGTVIEVGNHDDLVAAGGRYAEMFNLQAERFMDETEAAR